MWDLSSPKRDHVTRESRDSANNEYIEKCQTMQTILLVHSDDRIKSDYRPGVPD